MDTNTVRQVMDSAIQRHEETGASFIMTKDGKEELKYSCGLSDVEKGVSFDEIKKELGSRVGLMSKTKDRPEIKDL